MTGVSPERFNAQGLQGSPNNNSPPQDLGLIYSIDDRTRDEPWIKMVNDGREFAPTPYIGHVNDRRSSGTSSAASPRTSSS